jgi:hypothetical protein
MSLCAYKDSLGRPGEGIHERRIGDFAFWDVFMTAVGAGLLAYAFQVNVFIMFIILMVSAIVLHAAFCVDTALNVKLGLSSGVPGE